MNEPPLLGQVYEDGRDGRYRLWTVDYLPWDAAPPGLVMVSVLPWDVTVEHSFGPDQWRVHAVRVPWQPGAPHALDGWLYPTEDAARRAAYEAGIVAFLLTEDDRHRYDLPVEEAAA